MFFKAILIIVSILLTVAPGVFAQDENTAAYSLQQCYSLALKRSFILSDQRELIAQAEARLTQAKAAFLPELNLNATHFRQDRSSQTFPGASLNRETTANFNVRQNLFNGFKSFAAIKQNKFERISYQQALREAKLQLFDDVADAFYSVLKNQKDIENYTNELSAYAQRREELVRFKSQGRARESDVTAVETSIADLEAQIANSRGLLGIANENIAFLIGSPGDVALIDQDDQDIKILQVDHWTENIDSKPSVVEAQNNLKAQKQKLIAARAGYWPTADFSGNKYVSRQGVYRDVDWDILFSVSFPLFTGGRSRGEVAEAYSKVRQLEVALEQIREEALRDIRSNYRTVEAQLHYVDKLEQAQELGYKYQDLLIRDYQQGLATNVDVLASLANLYSKNRLLDQAKLTAKYQFIKLQVNAGLIDIEK